jgi:hypothetical protein
MFFGRYQHLVEKYYAGIGQSYFGSMLTIVSLLCHTVALHAIYYLDNC